MKKSLTHCMVAIMLLSGCTSSESGKSGAFKITGVDGETIASITISSNEVVVVDKVGSLTGVAKRSDKRKYYNPENTMVYAVKLDDDGFKLRDSNEQLIWKVKLYDDKIKVANNEEMLSAWEVKLRDEGKLKLEKNDSEIKSIRLSEAAEYNEVEGKYRLTGFGRSLGAGVLMIDDLKEREKFIIMAELLKRGR